MIVSRILHAGYIFESAGVRIAFDPVFETPFSTNCFPFPAVEFAPEALAAASADASLEDGLHSYDAVFISHFHDDHCSLISLNAIPRATPIYLYCVHEELFAMIRELGFVVHRLEVDAPVGVGGFTVTPRLALDPDVDAVYEICAEGLAVLNVVDAWIDPSVLELRKSWDLVLWPFQTMRELDLLMPTQIAARSDEEIAEARRLPPEWVEQLTKLNARFVVPSSCQFRFEEWSWANLAYFPITYAQFAREIARSTRINAGEVFELTPAAFNRIGRLPWVKQMGPQDVDYEYDARIFEVARAKSDDSTSLSHRGGTGLRSGQAPGSFAQTTTDLASTTAEIARHFPALTADERALVERFCEGVDVTLFDHEGRSVGNGVTEAIAYKVYRAMIAGEQITSMYLRSEDVDTDELIAKLSQDPLGYQRAQLKELKKRARTSS